MITHLPRVILAINPVDKCIIYQTCFQVISIDLSRGCKINGLISIAKMFLAIQRLTKLSLLCI